MYSSTFTTLAHPCHNPDTWTSLREVLFLLSVEKNFLNTAKSFLLSSANSFPDKFSSREAQKDKKQQQHTHERYSSQRVRLVNTLLVPRELFNLSP